MSTMSPSTVIRWLGQACFLLTLLQGTRVLIDPVNPQVGYKIAAHSIPANFVFVSHEHFDHNYVEAAKGVGMGEGALVPYIIQPLSLGADPSVVTGREDAVQQRQPVDHLIYKQIAAYHDAVQGAKRGQDTITLFDENGLRICHLGDLGQLASDSRTTQGDRQSGCADDPRRRLLHH